VRCSKTRAYRNGSWTRSPVEFDLEDVPSAPVGSLLFEGLNEGGAFQRVADDEEAAILRRVALRKSRLLMWTTLTTEVADERSRDVSFQRISDDEQGQAQAEPVRESPSPIAKERNGCRASRKKTGVIGRLFKSKKSEDDENERQRAVIRKNFGDTARFRSEPYHRRSHEEFGDASWWPAAAAPFEKTSGAERMDRMV